MVNYSSDHGVSDTALDSAKCKLSAVHLGYFQDDFLSFFVEKPSRRTPLIHRGYFLRHFAMNTVVDQFLEKRACPSQKLQIISLGAGYDTLFFNLIHKKKQKNLSVFEVDCTSVVKAKCEVMRKSDVFPHLFSAQNKSDIFFGDDTFGCDLTSCQSTYRLFACDIGEPIKLMKSLCIHGADTHLPTLLIAECVISYLDPQNSAPLLKILCQSFADITAVMYDPIGLDDVFTETQLGYFDAKGCSLSTFSSFRCFSDHWKRFLLASKWMECAILDMNVILENFVEEAERCRFQMIEPFDEFAAWKIFNRHYAMFLLSNRAIHEHSFVCTRILQNWRSAQDSFSAIVHIPSTIPQRSLIIRKACFYRNSIDSVLIRKLFRETHNEYETFPAVRKFITGRMNHDLKFLERIFYMRDRCFFWVAQWGTEIVGCVGLLESDMIHHSLVGYLSRLSVDKRYRRQGIASILVKALESFATAKGFQELVAETINSMAAAQNTYNALGYHVSAKVEYTDFTLIRFHKKL